MSLSGNKKNVFTTIGAYTSMQQQGDLPDLRNTFSSVNNKRDVLPFLLDIMKVVKGSDGMIELTGQLFTDFTDTAEPQAKSALKNQAIQSNAGNQLPTQFRNSGSGITVPAKVIDLFGKLKTNPNSQAGGLLYSDNSNTFDKSAYEAVSNSGTFVPYNNMQIRYNENADTFTVKSTSDSGTIGDWIGGFIDNTQFIDKKEVITSALDLMYGTITANQGKSEQETLNQLKIDKILEKIIAGEEDLSISSNELNELMKRSQELQAGLLNYDFGCGIVGVSLSLDEFENVVSQISDSTDAFAVGNVINNTIEKSFGEDEDVFNENQETVKDGFFYRLINGIYLVFIKSLSLTPQARIIQAVITAFQNNGISTLTSDFSVDIENMKTFYKCIVKELLKMLNEFIYTLIIILLIQLLKPVVRKIIKEKINSYLGVLKSLVSSKT